MNIATRSPVSAQTWTLGRVAQSVGAVVENSHHEAEDLLITGVQEDSRQCGSGDLFVAVRGHEQDGLRHARDAVERGAVGIVAEQDPNAGVPWLHVHDARTAAGRIADFLYGDPSRDLALIGNLDVQVLFDDDLSNVRAEVDRCMAQANSQGGYMFSSCNSIFAGMSPLAVAEMYRYQAEVAIRNTAP